MDTLLKSIINSPKLPMYFKEIQQVLENEQQKRQQLYEEMTEQEKVEFIEGEVVVHSPVKKWHNDAERRLLLLICAHNSIHNQGFVGYEKILIRLTRNDYEPDICFFKTAKSEKFTDNQMFFPSPDFVVEVLSESTEKRDRGVKFEDYALHRVEEYWLVDPEKKLIEQYFLENGDYQLNLKARDGTIESNVIDGFNIPIQAIFDEEINRKVLLEVMKDN